MAFGFQIPGPPRRVFQCIASADRECSLAGLLQEHSDHVQDASRCVSLAVSVDLTGTPIAQYAATVAPSSAHCTLLQPIFQA